MRTRPELLEMLLDHVRRMRTAQKEYFQFRSRTALADAKAAERQVDDVLSMIEAKSEGQHCLQLQSEPDCDGDGHFECGQCRRHKGVQR